MRPHVTALVVASAIGIAAPAARAQAPEPAFEVASVKSTRGVLTPTFFQPTTDRLNAGNVSLRMLLQLAYDVEPEQVVGGPDWIDRDRYDIVARAARPFTPQTQWRAMLRSLLLERFHLTVRRETRPAQVLALVVARADGRLGAGMRRAAAPCDELFDPSSPPGADPCGLVEANRAGATGRMAVRGLTIEVLTRLLRHEVGQPVSDETGLKGAFDWELAFSPRVPGDTDAPSIFAAVQEQLGLKLERRRGTLEVIAIDHAERPSAN